MRTALLAAAALMCFALPAGESDAKRLPPPRVKFCNKGQSPVAVATHGYSGRGQFSSRGWREIRAGACKEIAADRFHVGAGKPPRGLDARSSERLCVKRGSFTLRGNRSDLADKGWCARQGGRLARFYRPRRGVKVVTLK